MVRKREREGEREREREGEERREERRGEERMQGDVRRLFVCAFPFCPKPLRIHLGSKLGACFVLF